MPDAPPNQPFAAKPPMVSGSGAVEIKPAESRVAEIGTSKMEPPHLNDLEIAALEIEERAVEIPSGGNLLAGRLFTPQSPELLVLIAAATGVPSGYYAGFARWLSECRRAAVLIFDYGDFNTKDPIPRAKTSAASMRSWGVEDSLAARDWLKAQLPELPLWVIGHSLGAIALPFQPRLGEIDRFISVSAGPVHWRDHPWPMRGMAFALWKALGPLAVRRAGYFPGQKFGLGAPLPAGVFRQWRRWCTTPGSCAADPAMPGLQTQGFKAPVTLIAVADDAMMPPEVVWRMEAWLPEAAITRRVLVPADHGLARLGHIAAFAGRNRAVWPSLIA